MYPPPLKALEFTTKVVTYVMLIFRVGYYAKFNVLWAVGCKSRPWIFHAWQGVFTTLVHSTFIDPEKNLFENIGISLHTEDLILHIF